MKHGNEIGKTLTKTNHANHGAKIGIDIAIN